jgi:hypothetical protein
VKATRPRIEENFSIPELTTNMRNTTNVSKAANEPQNPWNNYPDGPEAKSLQWNRKIVRLGAILQQALDLLQTDYKDLLILPLKEDLRACYDYCNGAAAQVHRNNFVCLYGTSDGPDSTTIPPLDDKQKKIILRREATLVSSMTFVQGAEFKSVIAFIKEEGRTPKILLSNKKIFMSSGNVKLRAVINLVTITVRD